MEISSQLIMGVSGAVITLGTAYLTIRKVIRTRKKDKNAERAEILQEAKEHTSLVRKDLEGQIKALETKIDSLEGSINKDMGHLKESYVLDVKNLASKIEDLREQLAEQHGSLVQLLTKMIDNSKD